MVPSQHSAVRRALSSYSAPTGLRRRRKDVNGCLSPLALTLLPPRTTDATLQGTLTRITRPPLYPACTPLLFVLLPRTGLHPLAFFPTSSRCLRPVLRPRGCHPRGTCAENPVQQNSSLGAARIGKNGPRKKEEATGKGGEDRRGVVFSKKRSLPFYFSLSLPLSLPRFLFRSCYFLLCLFFRLIFSFCQPLYYSPLSPRFNFISPLLPFLFFSPVLFFFGIIVPPIIIHLGSSGEARFVLATSSLVSFFRPALSVPSCPFSQTDVFCPVSRSRRSPSL